MDWDFEDWSYQLGIGHVTTTDPAVKSRKKKHPIGFAPPEPKKTPTKATNKRKKTTHQ
jgi:hypothetical protein